MCLYRLQLTSLGSDAVRKRRPVLFGKRPFVLLSKDVRSCSVKMFSFSGSDKMIGLVRKRRSMLFGKRSVFGREGRSCSVKVIILARKRPWVLFGKAMGLARKRRSALEKTIGLYCG